MKKYPKVVQCDKRGQIVIPKDIRSELKIDEGTAFWMFSVEGEGILLKKIPLKEFSEEDESVKEISQKSEKVGIKKDNLQKTVKKYKKTKEGNLEVI